MPMLWTDEMNPMKNQGTAPPPRKFDKDGKDVTDEPVHEAGQEQVTSEALGPKDPPDEDAPEKDEDDEDDEEVSSSPRPPLGTRPSFKRPGRR